ncbi:MAG TPA: hypothetical protein VK543_03450 [Puia sp.]|nr:hypothetical protein [Puia sp.]
MLFKNIERRNKVIHMMGGLLILLHAYEKYSVGEPTYIYFAVSGLLFSLIALLHEKLAKNYPWIDGVFFGIEGLLSIVVAIDYFRMEKKALPYAYLVAAALQFLAAFKKSKRGIKRQEQHSIHVE